MHEILNLPIWVYALAVLIMPLLWGCAIAWGGHKIKGRLNRRKPPRREEQEPHPDDSCDHMFYI